MIGWGLGNADASLWMVGVAAATTAVLGCGVVVLYNLPGMQEPSFGTDKALLRQNKARLAEVVAEFNSLPLPEGVIGKDAKYFGCGTESGGLYQPFVLRELTVPPSPPFPPLRRWPRHFENVGGLHRPTASMATSWRGIAATGP